MQPQKIKKKDFSSIAWNECWENLQYFGYVEAGVPAMNKRLLHGGKVSFQIEDRLSSDHFDLFIGQGGLRNKGATKEEKKIFRNDVSPILATKLKNLDPQFNGRIRLHYRNGLLDFFEVKTK